MADEVRYSDYQLQVYLRWRENYRPEFPLKADDLERRAREALGDGPYGYVAGAAGTEDTMRANADAFRRWRIVPRMLTDVSERRFRRTVLGTDMPAPVLLAPIGVQSIVHRDGELATARAAKSMGIPMVLSTASSTSIEDVAGALGDTPRWFQLYWPSDREVTKSFLKRAEDNGYSAIVVTLDTKQIAWRPRDLSNAYLPFLWGEGIAVYLSDPAFREGLGQAPEENPDLAVLHYGRMFSDLAHKWDDLAFLKENTRLPVILKGIVHPDDAHNAVEHGVDGIVVSNHGGRQVDGAIGALDALPGVVDAVAGRIPVLFDSGIRSGADIVKALALGAQAVLLGRVYMWGLALGGERGVRHVLETMLAEFDLTMGLSGCASVDDLTPEVLTRID